MRPTTAATKTLRKDSGLWVVSPMGFAALATLLFAVAWMFPPDLYRKYLEERDFIFLDPTAAFYFGLCVAGFAFGVFSVRMFPTNLKRRAFRPSMGLKPFIFLALPIALAVGLNVWMLKTLTDNHPQLLPLLLAGEGDVVKNAASEIGAPMLATIVITGLVWWAIWRLSEQSMPKNQRRAAILLITLLSTCVLANCVLTVGRTELMPFLLGTVAVLLIIRLRNRPLPTRRLLSFIAAAALTVIGMFVMFSVIRGAEDAADVNTTILAYTLASYNRLSALLSGRLHYPCGGTGIYISPFVSYSNLLHKILPIADALGWKPAREVWLSEFDAMSRAGLNADVIWAGTFGYLFSDFGWMTPAFMILYGAVVGTMWQSILAGRLLGIILYPWCAFCILFWQGTNLLLDAKFVLLALLSIVLAHYERLVGYQSPQAGACR